MHKYAVNDLLTGVISVAAGVEPPVLAGTPRPPAIVDRDVVLDGTVVVEPGKELGAVPVGVWSLPVSVRPQHVRLVHVDNLVHLRNAHLLREGGRGERDGGGVRYFLALFLCAGE